MSSYIKQDTNLYNYPSDASLSSSNACETKDSKMNDGSGTSYAIATFSKPEVTSYTLAFNLSNLEFEDVLSEAQLFDALVGLPVDLIYCSQEFKSLIITDVSVTLALDSATGITSASLSIQLKENVVVTQKTQAKVSKKEPKPIENNARTL